MMIMTSVDETFTITYSADYAKYSNHNQLQGTILSDDNPRVSIKVNNLPSDSFLFRKGNSFKVDSKY